MGKEGRTGGRGDTGHLSLTSSLLSLQDLQAEAVPLPSEGTILTHPLPLPFPHPIQSTDYFSPAHSSPPCSCHCPCSLRKCHCVVTWVTTTGSAEFVLMLVLHLAWVLHRAVGVTSPSDKTAYRPFASKWLPFALGEK